MTNSARRNPSERRRLSAAHLHRPKLDGAQVARRAGVASGPRWANLNLIGKAVSQSGGRTISQPASRARERAARGPTSARLGESSPGGQGGLWTRRHQSGAAWELGGGQCRAVRKRIIATSRARAERTKLLDKYVAPAQRRPAQRSAACSWPLGQWANLARAGQLHCVPADTYRRRPPERVEFEIWRRRNGAQLGLGWPAGRPEGVADCRPNAVPTRGEAPTTNRAEASACALSLCLLFARKLSFV